VPQGLTIIGVHGNDYKGQPSVASGVKDYKINYPVVDDVEKKIWKDYGIRSRPAWALIGKDGALIQKGIGLVTTPDVQKRIEAALDGRAT
jgi:hypothetical protein